jgi:hypothetical protein
MLLQGYGLYLDTSRVTQIVTKDVSWIVIFYIFKELCRQYHLKTYLNIIVSLLDFHHEF